MIGIYAITFVVLAVLTSQAFGIYSSIGVLVLSVTMLVGFLVSFAVARALAGRRALENLAGVGLGVLIVPVLILLAIAGTCVPAVLPGLR